MSLFLSLTGWRSLVPGDGIGMRIVMTARHFRSKEAVSQANDSDRTPKLGGVPGRLLNFKVFAAPSPDTEVRPGSWATPMLALWPIHFPCEALFLPALNTYVASQRLAARSETLGMCKIVPTGPSATRPPRKDWPR